VRRLIISLGRGGTVLIAIGLALLLVSLIPGAQTGSHSLGSSHIGSRRWSAGYSEGVLTPQQSLRFNVTANGDLNVYLLEVTSQTIRGWINETHLGSVDVSNVTYLEEFLVANPESIIWQNEIRNGKIEYEYVPTKITNTTLVLSNPSSDFINVQYEGSVTSHIAPRGKVRTLAQWTIPFGFVLATPWLIDSWRAKTRSRGSKLLTKPT